MKCRIADLNIVFENRDVFMEKRCANFFSEFNNPDLTISTTEKAIELEYKNDPSKRSLGYQESSCLLKEFANSLPYKNAIFMHGALFNVNDRGILLCAQSGTGKTTHMLLWKQLLGDKMTVVNGDKPIIRFFDAKPNTPYAYGAPWCGKENYGINSKTVLTDICFLNRSLNNSVSRLNNKDCVNEIMQHIHIPYDATAMSNTISIVNNILNNVNFWKINCNMEPEAAKIAYEAIFNAKCKVQNAK